MNSPVIPHERPTDTPRRVIRALFEWRWSAIGFFAVFYTLLMLIAYNFPPLYEGEGHILIKAGRASAPEGVPMLANQMGLSLNDEDVVSEINIFLSEDVRARVADRLLAEAGEDETETFFSRLKDEFYDWCESIGLMPTLSPKERLILQLGRKVSVEVVPGTKVLEIAYVHQSPRRAEKVVRYMMEEYLRRHVEVHSDTGALAFFEDQTKLAQERVDAIQAKLTAFRLSHDGGDLSLQRTLLIQDLTQSQQDLSSLGAIDTSVEGLQGVSLQAFPELASFQQRLLDLQLQLPQLRALHNEDSPEVQTVLTQISETQKALAAQIQSKKDYLTRRVSDLREQLQKVEKDRAEFDDLTQQEQLDLGTLSQYARKAEEERISQAMDDKEMIGARVVDWPFRTHKPWFPNRFLMAILGILLGIPGAIATALIRAYFHSRVSTVQDVETEVGIPVLASIRRMPARAFAHGIPEAVMAAARAVMANMEKEGVQALHVAASTLGEGAATMASAVAIALAEAGRKVVFASTTGVSSPALANAGGEFLDLSGKTIEEQRGAVAESCAGDRMLILAGPPLASGVTGGVYASFADASLFVVSGTGVHFDAARRGAEVLRRFSPKILGAVLTQRRDPIPRLLYKRI